jgi:hypothetical protein
MAASADQQERLLQRRSKALQRALQRWMLKQARREAARQIKLLRKTADGGGWKVSKSAEVAKAENIHGLPADAEKELAELLSRFSVAQAKDASVRTGVTPGIKQVADPRRLERQFAGKEFKLKIFTVMDRWSTTHAKKISKETRRMVKESIMRVLQDASKEKPLPSAGEMARRIRTQFHGRDETKRVYAWSPERAALIARTELTQAENTGAYEGYKALDEVSDRKIRVRWLAKRDGRSGDRHHERMHGKEVSVGKKFTTPLGNKMRYPGDPTAPIEELANCRCAHRAVVTKEK